MAVFTYSARNAEGKKIDGVVTANDKASAQADLRKKSLSIISLDEKKKKSGFNFNISLGGPRERAKPKELVIVTRQIATMVSAGIPLIEALEIVEDQTENPGFRKVLGKVVDKIRGGADFSSAIGDFPKIFGKIYVNMVKAGEAGGQLDIILNRLAEFLEAQEALKREIKSAMTYPIISLFLIISITIGLIVGIIPKFKEIFTQMRVKDLPLPTTVLLAISDAFLNYFHFVILGVVVFSVLVVLYFRTNKGQWQLHWLSLHMPVFGVLFRKVAISRFSRTFATLIQSGVPILAALEIVAGTAGNRLIEEGILYAKDKVSKGEPLGEPLASTKVFPSMVTKMISIGEKSGALEKLLTKISEFYDQEVKATVEALTSLIEPILIVIMGVIVGGVVLSIFLPILKIQETLANK